MSRGDRDGFIVKFVGSKGQTSEYAAKAYEVNLSDLVVPNVINIPLFPMDSF